MPTGIYDRKKAKYNKGGFKKGHIPWSKGKKRPEFSGENHYLFGKHHSETTKKKIGEANKKYKGRIRSKETRIKISKARIGSKCHSWRGGITPKNRKIRNGIEFRLWREAVFARDNWICQKCKTKSKSGKRVCLHPHHILNFAQYPELRFAIDNGITLCKKCHMEFHKKYGKENNNQEQLEEFLKMRKTSNDIYWQVDYLREYLKKKDSKGIEFWFKGKDFNETDKQRILKLV